MNDELTETPRTDAVQFQPHPISLNLESEMLRALSRKLERELAASNAEVERLKAINADMRNFLARAIHNEGFNEEKALKFIYQ